MNKQLEKVLVQVQKGEISPEEALKILKDFPYEDLLFAKIDHHRELRRGFPEVIFGLGKTDAQILKIAKAILKKVKGVSFSSQRGLRIYLWPKKRP
jgi:NCAIR mutase (PurE)-related protein